MIQVDTCHGKMWVFEEDTGCSAMLREYGEYSRFELELMRSYLTPESVVLDIGAHIGAFTVPLAGMCKTVYAFEPQTEVVEVLQKNTADLPNVKILPVALGSVHEYRYYTSGLETRGSTQMLGTGETKVEVFALDAFGLAPDFIKLDVEGMECDIIYGGINTILDYRPIIFAERSIQYYNLLQLLSSLGYVNCMMDLPIYFPNNYNKSKSNPYPGMAHLMDLAIPKEKING